MSCHERSARFDLRVVREGVRTSPRRREAASVLPAGLAPSLRCRRAPMGGRDDRCRSVDRGCASEWRCGNARVGSRGQLRPRRYTSLKTCPFGASGIARRGRRTARRIFLVALLVSLHPPNHRQPPTAFGTDNGRSALVAGTALHAPNRTAAPACQILIAEPQALLIVGAVLIRGAVS